MMDLVAPCSINEATVPAESRSDDDFKAELVALVRSSGEASRTLKLDLVYRHSRPTRAAARTAIFEYIEAFYNRERRQSTLGNLSPADYESQHALAAGSA